MGDLIIQVLSSSSLRPLVFDLHLFYLALRSVEPSFFSLLWDAVFPSVTQNGICLGGSKISSWLGKHLVLLRAHIDLLVFAFEKDLSVRQLLTGPHGPRLALFPFLLY